MTHATRRSLQFRVPGLELKTPDRNPKHETPEGGSKHDPFD